MNDDERDYIAMLERTQITEDHPLIQSLQFRIELDTIMTEIWAQCFTFGEADDRISVDYLVQFLESRGLGWSLDHTGNLIEARVWNWPHVAGRYRHDEVMPLAQMLAKAMYEVDWAKYPIKK